jgi:hypothetical protein
MKTSSILAVALIPITLGGVSAHAQTYVLESKVGLVGTVSTQGTQVTATSRNGTQVKRLQVVVTPFSNREVLTEMQTRGLIGTSTSGWSLVYLADASGAGGIYASKSAAIPVAVPADLLTVPVFGQALQTGTETTNPNGNTFVGVTEIALATATVHGQPVSGLARNAVRTATVTVQGAPYRLDTVSTTISFTGGGTGSKGIEIVRGTIRIGSAKVSTLTKLP